MTFDGAPGVQRVVLRRGEPSASGCCWREARTIGRTITPDLIASLAGSADVAVDVPERSGRIPGGQRLASDPGEDVEFSLERAVLLDRSPAFIVTQFGWNADNVGELIEVVDDRHVRIPAIAEAIRQTLGKIGIEAQVVTQEGATLWPQYRAREHELILAPWSPDYADPHANADAFARNPDNRPEAKLTGVLAWRNAWARDDLNAAVIRARDELDLERRAQLYLDLQRRLQTEGPYVIMFQQTEQIARRTEVTGFVSGPNFDHVWYRTVTKAGADLGG